MTTPQANEPNPYQASQPAGGILDAVGQAGAEREMTKKFRDQIHALGALWIIIGTVAMALGTFMTEGSSEKAGQWFLIFVFTLGICWFGIGVMTCLKQIWAVYVGLGLTYLSLLGNLVQLNFCGLVITVLVVLQGHRVIGWAKKMRDAGIPLNAKP